MREPSPALRAAQANLVALRSGREALKRRAAEDRRRREKEWREFERRDDIRIGLLVDELRALLPIERKYAVADAKGFKVDRGAWEEVDYRIETLQNELDGITFPEQTRCLRAYRKASKQ